MATRKKTGRARVPRDGSRPHEVHYVPRVVVKFRDDVQLPYKDEMEKGLEAPHVGAWRELAQRYPGIRMRRLFNSVKPARLATIG